MARLILIVDDNAINRRVLRHMLEDDYEIVEAAGGREALSLMRRERKRLSAVLLDVVMPELDGYETLRIMRGEPLLDRLPVIIVTGSGDEDSRVMALKLGANDFIAKPFNPDIIRHTLRNSIALYETASLVDAVRRDKLTGLYTREYFFEKAGELISSREPGSYIMSSVDIDNFKLINDQYGAEAGDETLRRIGEAIGEDIEELNAVGGRISADNFAVLLPSEHSGTGFLERYEERNRSARIRYPVSFSVGRYIVTDASLAPSAIYDRAYIAKQSVKGRYDKHLAYFDDSMLDSLLSQQEIVNDMDAAIRERQFEVWYQPQYNHASGALVGAEALVRWRHPEKGLVSPGQFIPVFEKNGFIYELDKYVWNEVCRRLRKWLDLGLDPLPVSVNISRYDVLRADLVEYINDLLLKYRLTTELLRLEITESAFSKASERMMQVVRQLVELGFIVEIDDFGSGYSSLNVLKDVPAQVLKLDMRFLEGGDNNERGGNILESVVRMAKWLGMSVIAEGVETRAKADYLLSVGCLYIQGFLYARPMPAADYEALCRSASKEREPVVLETVANLDNSRFWDPDSMDSLIFNSYVGGACIFEYNGERIETVRSTEKYRRLLGGVGLSHEETLKLNWLDYMDAESRAEAENAINRSAQTGGEELVNVRFVGLPGCSPEVHLRSALRVIATAGKRRLVYCLNENVTGEYLAGARERAKTRQLEAVMDNINGGVSLSIIRDGRTEFLYANEAFYQLLGCTTENFERVLSEGNAVMHPEDAERIKEAKLAAAASREPFRVEYRVVRPDGVERLLVSRVTVMDFPDVPEPVHLAVTNDITDMREAMRRERQTAEQMRAIVENINCGVIATTFDCENPDFVFSTDRFFELLGGTREEVEAEGPDTFAHINPEDIPALKAARAAVRRSGGKAVASFRTVTPDGREIWLREDMTLTHFEDVDGPVQLSVLSDITEEKQAERKALTAAAQVQLLMESAPTGFSRIRVAPDGSRSVVFINDKLCEMLGMERAEAEELYSRGMRVLIHPEDFELVDEAVNGMIETGAARSYRYRIRHAVSSYIWVSVFGRVTEGDEGELFLNLYYAEAEEQVKAEEKRRELLDKFPHGAALYEYDGKSLKALHLNKRYWEMVGRDAPKNGVKNVTEAVHPEDLGALDTELSAALAGGRDVVCELRILCGDGRYHPFHIIGRITPGENGLHYVYTSYTPIDENEMSFRETLPFVLSAIMGSSSDLSFAKDRELRYICASRAFANMAGFPDENSLRGKTDFDIFEPALAAKFRADDERLLKDGLPLTDMVEQIPSRDGTPHFSKTSKFALRDTMGNVIGIYGLGMDITKSLETESQLRLLTDNIPGGIATYEGSPEELGNVRLSYFSDGFARMLGFTREEFSQLTDGDPFGQVFDEDLPKLMSQITALVAEGRPMDCVYRARCGDGSRKYINVKALMGGKHGDKLSANAVLFDVTEQQEAMEKLRISEEENRIAMQHVGSTVCRFNVESRTMILPPEATGKYMRPRLLKDIPHDAENLERIAPESRDAYIAFYEGIIAGSKNGSAIWRSRRSDGWCWIEAHYSTIFSDRGRPVSAVISFTDVTTRQEKDAAYERWQQSIRQKNPESYTLFRCSVSKRSASGIQEGSLLPLRFSEGSFDFDRRSSDYATQYVAEEDRAGYIAALRLDKLLAGYYQGKRKDTLEYRELLPGGGFRWLRLTVELVEYPYSTEVEAYLMFEDIDREKRELLRTIERAETDPLTGLLNRVTLAARVDEAIRESAPGVRSAMLMLDLDGFKLVNDRFGHGVGDETLVEVARKLSSAVRGGDLVGRLGGDEFLLLLRDVASDAVVRQKARQICSLLRKSFSPEVELTTSIGIAVSPLDGSSFMTLYRKADTALYHVKNAGKDNCAFYSEELETDTSADSSASDLTVPAKRKMLIVDDNRIGRELLSQMFADEFIIETAANGSEALLRLRRSASAISIVLLDLVMPQMDGFAVLEKMNESLELQGIPVIVVSGTDEHETTLRAIRCGASDFITKPVDPLLLRLRVSSAISKVEKERKRAQNRFRAMQSEESALFRAIMDNAEVFWVLYDRLNGAFTYGPDISRYLAGAFDSRPLWAIMLEDDIAKEEDEERMSRLIADLCADRSRSSASLTLPLKTPSGQPRDFLVRAIKLSDGKEPGERLAFTFKAL